MTKKYILDMFPYPSGVGLHVGHVEGYTGSDVISRYYRMKGFEVLHPMGWDAFGLPAENFAIKKGIPPQESTDANIKNFKKYLQATELSYDWDREINSSQPEYYKWTQWIFIKLFEAGLAYKKKAPANWCPSCETVLANEQVQQGKCERCDTEVIQKNLDQWFFKITDYADRLIEGLDKVDWPRSTVAMQKNWIGRKNGHIVKFGDLEVFTTRIDTLNNVTFIALSPNHPFWGSPLSCHCEVASPLKQSHPHVIAIRQPAEKQSNQIATSSADWRTPRDDTPCHCDPPTGGEAISSASSFVIHPVTGKKIPVYKADYVLGEYGTGAVMGVPAYDERDRDFASKHQIDILDNGLDQSLEKYGTPAKFYHLRDWLVSRQRYWGAPIPMIFCKKCQWQPVAEKDLPVLLPTDVDFRPTGESPIARSKTFQKGAICPKCGGRAKREVDTMDTFVDSSWYFLRFCDPHNKKAAFSKELVKKWGPVDLYIGGAEHTVLHLMYSRFFYKVFCDLKLIDDHDIQEPFLKLRHQGMVLGPDNRKMSKRWGNVVGLDEVIPKFGSDTVRMYELFMGPFGDLKSWQTSGVEGISRFLHRLKRKFEEGYVSPNIDKLVAQVTADIESMSFNTAISSMMKGLNEMMLPVTSNLSLRGGAADVAIQERLLLRRLADRNDTIQSSVISYQETWSKFIRILAPFAPKLSEEMWNTMGHTTSVHLESWPTYQDTVSDTDTVTVIVQIDGKVRGRLQIDRKTAKDEQAVKQLAIESDKTGVLKKTPEYRTIFVPCKLINFYR